MKKRIELAIGVAAVVMAFPVPGFAQSTLEYATLISETSAAAAGAAGHKKESSQSGSQESDSDHRGVIGGAVTSLYGQSADVIGQKGAGLLGQLGQPRGVAAAASAPEAPAAPQETQAPVKPDQAAAGQKTVRLLLRNGISITGSLVEQNKDYVKVDSAGVTVTYFSDEIDKME